MRGLENIALWELATFSLEELAKTPLGNEPVISVGPVPNTNPPEVFEFDEFALSSRGLMGMVILPNNEIAVRDDIYTIHASVYGNTTQEVDLLPSDVMLTALSGKGTWDKSERGYNFLWPMAETLFPDPDVIVKIVLRFICSSELDYSPFTRVWKAKTYDPFAI